MNTAQLEQLHAEYRGLAGDAGADPQRVALARLAYLQARAEFAEQTAKNATFDAEVMREQATEAWDDYIDRIKVL